MPVGMVVGPAKDVGEPVSVDVAGASNPLAKVVARRLSGHPPGGRRCQTARGPEVDVGFACPIVETIIVAICPDQHVGISIAVDIART
jgi:hypothetical protein